MKPIQKGKLQLKKQAITNLTQTEQNAIRGGEEAWTTSIGKCTAPLCCGETQTCDWIPKITVTFITLL